MGSVRIHWAFMRVPARVLVLFSLYGLLAAPTPSRTAHAQGRSGVGARFEYLRGAGAERCPDRESLVKQVTVRLGFDPFTGGEGGRVRCEIVGADGGLRSRIETWDGAGRPTGTRSLTSQRNDCDDLVPALVLVVALASGHPLPPQPRAEEPPVVPTRVAPAPVRAAVPSSPPPPSPALPPPPPPPPRPTAPPARPPITAGPPLVAQVTPARETAPNPVARASAPPPPPSAAPPGMPVSLLVGAGALGTAGALPGPSWGALVTVGARRGAASLALQGRYDAPATQTVEGGRIRVWALSLAAVPCLHGGPFAACALVGAGMIRGSGEGVPGARTGADLWAVLGLRAAYAVPLGGTLSLMAHVDVLGAPVETVMRIGDSAVWTTPVVSGAAGLTLLARY
jgi:hypothetical protein